MVSCSTLYRAYPIATESWDAGKAEKQISCSTLYRAYPIATVENVRDRATIIFDLQYPLPGLSHCDHCLTRQKLDSCKSCSTLYRAYPIATCGLSLSEVDAYTLVVPSTGPIPLRLWKEVVGIIQIASCSTLYRAYPIATQ